MIKNLFKKYFKKDNTNEIIPANNILYISEDYSRKAEKGISELTKMIEHILKNFNKDVHIAAKRGRFNVIYYSNESTFANHIEEDFLKLNFVKDFIKKFNDKNYKVSVYSSYGGKIYIEISWN